MPKPVSDKQRLANRRNAQKSTGPRAPEGKARYALELVRYEKMLDRRLHRALAHLDRRRRAHRRPTHPDQASPHPLPDTPGPNLPRAAGMKKRCQTKPISRPGAIENAVRLKKTDASEPTTTGGMGQPIRNPQSSIGRVA